MSSFRSWSGLRAAAALAVAALAACSSGGDTQDPMVQQSLQQITAKGSARGLELLGTPEFKDLSRDADGRAHVRWQTTVAGVPIWGGDMIAHMNPDGSLESATPPRVPSLHAGGVEGVDEDATAMMAATPAIRTVPLVSADQAMHSAEQSYGCPGCMTAPSTADLWVVSMDMTPRLVWGVQMHRMDGSAQTAEPFRFIDATTGDMLVGYDNLHSHGIGHSLYSAGEPIDTSQSTVRNTVSYYMDDLGRNVGVFDASASSACAHFQDADNLWDTAAQAPAVDALYGAEKFLDMMSSNFSRNGIDGKGGPGTCKPVVTTNFSRPLMSLYVHYGQQYNNAFWSSSDNNVHFGDGDGKVFSPLVEIDIVGHEMMHGVTQYSANLVYANESGALNESWSDVFGALLKLYTKGSKADIWNLAVLSYTPGTSGDALRSLSDPHSLGYPDHYSERSVAPASSDSSNDTTDNGGVHYNSSIANHAFYLLANGGTHRLGGSMSGIGTDAAGQVWYRALTTYMTSSTNFAAARTATVKAAQDLYGSSAPNNVTAVTNAWCLVGVGTIDNCPAALGAYFPVIFDGGFEDHGNSSWTLQGDPCAQIHSGSLAHTGQGFLFVLSCTSNQGYTPGSATQQFTLPSSPTSLTLSFSLSINASKAKTSARDQMPVELLDASGRVVSTLRTFSNLDDHSPGPSASGAQKPYVQYSFDLLKYRGQTLTLRFRETSPDYTSDTDFFIDDVAVTYQ